MLYRSFCDTISTEAGEWHRLAADRGCGMNSGVTLRHLVKEMRCKKDWDYIEKHPGDPRSPMWLTITITAPVAYHFVCDRQHSITGVAAGASERHQKELREDIIEKLRQGLELCDPTQPSCCEHNNWPCVVQGGLKDEYKDYYETSMREWMDRVSTKNFYRLTAAAKTLDIPLTTLRSAILRKEIDFSTTACGLQLVTLDAVRDWAKKSYRPHD